MKKSNLYAEFDWRHISRLVFASRTMDDIEETELVPQKHVLYQFSARGHDVPQIILGSLLQHPKDVVGAYYRSRPLMLSLGLDFEDAVASPMAKSGGYSNGKDIGVVCNLPSQGAASVLPMAGDVGSQYTPAAGAAQAIEYRRSQLNDSDYDRAISVVLGGEGSVATNGFWAALTMATTLKLPMLFYIEDNGYAISVTSDKQTPGGNIAENLKAFKNLKIWDGNGSDPAETAAVFMDAVEYVRSRKGPGLVRLTVPRLSGHSGQDTQAYKPPDLVEQEKKRDPLHGLEKFLVPGHISQKEWNALRQETEKEVRAAVELALNRPEPEPESAKKYVFEEQLPDGSPDLPQMGGLAREGHRYPEGSETPNPEPARINMLTAIRRTMEYELATNPKLLIFGEDVGPKGGVHAATTGLQEKYGEARVFDTSLSEEGIIGRAVGMAICGLKPVAEIQFRKYADPACEQLDNCGTIRWRTHNRFAAPIVVRMPGGFGSKCGDPWHSECNEVMWLHGIGWRVVFPSNAEDAVGLLRSAMRCEDPVIFFEHRHCLDMPWARRPYPGNQYIIPFGKGKMVQRGNDITVVTWGAMVERCENAAAKAKISADIIDLRTLSPWDQPMVLDSVRRTRRCLIVHEDGLTAGFGAEIAALVAKECFFDLDAPVERLATPDIPIPYNVRMMNAVVPGVDVIADKLVDLVTF